MRLQLLFAAAILVLLPFNAVSARQPDIVYILADDLGWNDVSFHGSEIRTPHIDRLATESVVLDRFYVCRICSPTRAGLLTGRYPIRFGLQEHVVSPFKRDGLPPDEVTLAEMLGQAGYEHRAAFGKWHLGLASTRFHPLNQGFTLFYGHYNGAIDYFSRERVGQLDWHQNFNAVHEAGYSTDLVGNRVVDYIASRPADKPFFAYVAFNAPHSPVQALDDDLKSYGFDPNGPRAPNTDAGLARREKAPEYGEAGKGNTVRQTFAAMTTAMDRQVGDILEAIEARDPENTLLIFHSDNGGVPVHGGNNKPLRGDKFTTFEGGVRVVSMVRWPAEFAGGRTLDTMTAYVDWWPTLAAIAGYTTAAHEVDGMNILPMLKGEAVLPHRTLFLGQKTVATQQYKLKVDELFDIAVDPYETADIADKHPDVVSRLMKERAAFEQLAGPVSESGLPQPESWPPKEWKLPEEK